MRSRWTVQLCSSAPSAKTVDSITRERHGGRARARPLFVNSPARAHFLTGLSPVQAFLGNRRIAGTGVAFQIKLVLSEATGNLPFFWFLDVSSGLTFRIGCLRQPVVPSNREFCLEGLLVQKFGRWGRRPPLRGEILLISISAPWVFWILSGFFYIKTHLNASHDHRSNCCRRE